jgi:hypothetical protein
MRPERHVMKTTHEVRAAAEKYQLAQAQTLVDIYNSTKGNDAAFDRELAKHIDANGKIKPTFK